jgi:hypothetical protein
MKELENMLAENMKESKEKKVAKIVESNFKAGITYEQFGKLEVEHFVNNQKKGKWIGYSLSFLSQNGTVECQALRDAISNELKSYFPHFVYTQMVDSAIWIRVSIEAQRNPLSSDSIASKVSLSSLFTPINIVHYPHSDCLFINGLTAQYKKFVLFSLKNAMNCSSVEPMDLECPDLTSMKELALERASQGRFKRYRSENKNPLDRATETESVVELPANPLLNPAPNIVYENAMEIEQKKNYIAHEFGKEEAGGPTAALEYVKFVDYACPINGIEGKDSLTLGVKFEGKNVIAGFRECLHYNIVHPNLPPCLENLHSNSKNIYHGKDVK